ncbi:MAG: MMPL family transporter, partial [Acidimicrobiia bacterium]
MERLGRFVVRFRVAILIGALMALGLFGALGGGVAESLSSGGFEDPGSESVRGAEVLAEEFGADTPGVILVITAKSGSIDDPAVVQAGLATAAALADEEGVTEVSSYWSLGSPPSLRSVGGDRALVFASIEGDQAEVLNRSGELAEEYRGDAGIIEIHVGGIGPLFSEVQEVTEADLLRAETIAFPVTAVLLVIIFGTVVAAALPLAVGVFAIVSTFFILQILTGFTEVSIFALNLTTALGLGLAIDYALFIVSRF